MVDLVEQQGQDDGRWKPEDKVVKADKECIPYEPCKVGAGKKTDEVLKTDPGASPKAPARRKIFKRDKSAVHGFVGEKGVKNNHRQNQEVQGPVPLHIFTKSPF
jgi:hypothetical protein